jgi:peptide chain release factor 2
MFADDLKEQLRALEPDITTIKTYWNNTGQEKLFQNLEKESLTENFWQHPEQTRILKQLQQQRACRDQYHYIVSTYNDLYELIGLFADNDEDLIKLKQDIALLKKSVAAFKITLLLNEEQDEAHCFLSINAGAGGTEAQDWANMLLRMYLMFCQNYKWTAQIIDYQPGEEAGIKSATIFVKAKNAYGLLKSEHGIHRLVRISPFDSNKRRHTSFVSVTVIPEAPMVGEIVIDPSDLRIDTYRASGAGGQHVNKTESAVRITHLPTGIVTQCQNERSQTQNKETAFTMLRAKLAQKAKEEHEAKMSSNIEKKKIEWGSQIRSYVLHPYKMVKDHRTDFESSQPDLVLDGNLTEFVEQYLVWRAKMHH